MVSLFYRLLSSEVYRLLQGRSMSDPELFREVVRTPGLEALIVLLGRLRSCASARKSDGGVWLFLGALLTRIAQVSRMSKSHSFFVRNRLIPQRKLCRTACPKAAYCTTDGTYY